MASSTLNVLSGIAAAAAGFAGEKVSKNGSVSGLNLAAIVPALLGKSGGASGIVGTLTSLAIKSGLLNSSKLGNLAGLAGSLLSFGKTGTVNKTAGGLEGLAAAIAGTSGSGASLGSIATLASSLVESVKDKRELTGIANELGKTLNSKSGISFSGRGLSINALDKVIENDVKGDLFKAILKGLS